MTELIDIDQIIKRSVGYAQMILVAEQMVLNQGNKISLKNISSGNKPKGAVETFELDAHRVNYKPLPWSDERLFYEVTEERNELLERLTRTS